MRVVCHHCSPRCGIVLSSLSPRRGCSCEGVKLSRTVSLARVLWCREEFPCSGRRTVRRGGVATSYSCGKKSVAAAASFKICTQTVGGQAADGNSRRASTALPFIQNVCRLLVHLFTRTITASTTTTFRVVSFRFVPFRFRFVSRILGRTWSGRRTTPCWWSTPPWVGTPWIRPERGKKR